MSNSNRFYGRDGHEPANSHLQREINAVAEGVARRDAEERAARAAEVAAARRDDQIRREAWNSYVEQLKAASALLTHVADVLRGIRFPADYARHVLVGHDDERFGHAPPRRAKTRQLIGWQLVPAKGCHEYVQHEQFPHFMYWTEENVLTADGALMLVGVTGDMFPSNELGVPRTIVPARRDLYDPSFVQSHGSRLSSGKLYGPVPDCRKYVVDFVYQHPELVPYFASPAGR